MSASNHSWLNKKKQRKEKKEKDQKDVEERCEIVKEIHDKLIEVHLAFCDDDGSISSEIEAIQEFLKVLQEYKKPGVLSAFSGVIKLPELRRNLEYILPIKKFIAHGVRLVSDDKKDYEV
jgi:hypothetical protein